MIVSANIPGKRNGVAKVAGLNPVTPTNTKTVACVYRSGRFFMPAVSAQKLAPAIGAKACLGLKLAAVIERLVRARR